MYYILSSLLGIFVKLFDDIIDMQILIDPYYINLLKYLIICISTIICINDYNFCIITLLALLTSNYFENFDNIFWVNYLLIIILITILFIYKFSKITYIILFFILIVPCVHIYEIITFKINFSACKQETRQYSIIFNTILFIFLEYYNLIAKYNLHFFKKFIIFVNSYFIISLIIYWLIYK
jgi:hypothetical protein